MRKDFALCFNEKYVPYACVTIKSIVDHMSSKDNIYIHILTDKLSEKSVNLLRNLNENVKYNVEILIVDDDDIFNGLNMSWSVYTWYRVLLPNLLDHKISKVLYLDCDIIVNNNLDNLFSLDMRNGQAIAACLDIESYNSKTYRRLGYEESLGYICAGCLLMNLEIWRKEDLSNKIINFAKTHPEKIAFPDQCAINYICRSNKIVLPPTYGVVVPFFRRTDFIKQNFQYMDDIINNPKIIHYAGYHPWIWPMDKSLHSNLWWRTYKSLRMFPKIRLRYYLTMFSYFKRKVISYITQKSSKQYFEHKRITKKFIYKTLKTIGHENELNNIK